MEDAVAWFSRMFSASSDRHSSDVLKQCVVSLKGMEQASLYIESGIEPIDNALLCQPIISTLNAICGREGDDRFKRVEVGVILDALAQLQRTGLLKDVLALVPQPLGIEILRACGILLSRTTDLTSEAQEAVLRVAEQLDVLVAKLNQSANAR